MKIQTSRLCIQTSVWVLASALCVMTVTGCAVTSDLTSSLGADAPVQGLSGTVHGGPNPVTGATVTLYATKTTASPSASNNYGYGVLGQSLGTATTDVNGNFSFNAGTETACPSGQQAYIVSSGGKTGTHATNSAALLMAAIGPCAGLTEGSGAGATKVIINEPTTIAAAYAIGQFMTVSGTTVNISAPANNNAATAACATSGTSPNIITTGCAASGLAHAFQNAANLVNSASGVANTTFASGSTVTVTVPQQLINTLANSVEACINSANGSSPACTTLMTNATPTELFSPTPPANTLQALLYLAQYPSMAAGTGGTGPPIGSNAGNAVPSAATTALFNLANSNAYYAPALTASPDDFTIAIDYVLAPSGTAVNVWGLGTDIKDNIYVYTNSTPLTVYSLTSSGAQNWATATGTNCGFSTTGSRCSMTTDTLGNAWVVDGAGLTKMSAASGSVVTTYTTGDSLHMALVDVGNNVWLAAYNLGTQTGASALEELPQGASTIVEAPVGGKPLTSTTSLHDLAFDSAGNLWSASDAAGGVGLGSILMISGTGSLTAPSFGYTSTSNPALYLNTTGVGGGHSWSPVIDGSGNAWVFSETDLNEVTSGGSETGGAINYAGSYSTIYGPTWEAGVTRNAFQDGDGKFVVVAASTGAGYISVYYPNAPSDNDAGAGLGGADVYMNPCYVAPATTTCAVNSGGQSTIVNVPRGVTIDASGAIWSGFTQGTATAAGDLIQLLGPGAPVWSQHSWIPKALAPNLTGGTTSLRPF